MYSILKIEEAIEKGVMYDPQQVAANPFAADLERWK